jgi:glycosyltransferase involved in cell wall biosynthesis
MTSRPRILMASPNYWTSPFQVGSHHLARGFVSEGWDVAFVSDPISPLHLLGGRSTELRDRLGIYRAGGREDLDGHLWAYVPGALVTPRDTSLLRGRWLHDHWSRLTVPNLARMVRQRGFGDVDVLYFDSAAQRFWLDVIPHRRSVLRIADRNSGFAGYTKEMQRLEAQLAASVDLVVYSGSTLASYVAGLGARRSLHLPNGVDFARYVDLDDEAPGDLAAIPRPIAIYVGAMDEWFDFETVDALAGALPDVSFVLIGPDKLARGRITPRPNLHLLGRRPHALVPRYLQHADVGLIPFDVQGHPDLVNGVHPLKLYEYLACGLPVVATRWEELVALDAPIALCETVAEQVAAVRRATEMPNDPDPGIRFASAADWRLRVMSLTTELELSAIPN